MKDCEDGLDPARLETAVENLGPCRFDSPLRDRGPIRFTGDDRGVLVDPGASRDGSAPAGGPSFELAGPRRRTFFDPARTRAGIITCGGLCPGLNDVIRAIVMELWFRYGVDEIYGFRYGMEGLVPEYGHRPVPLLPEVVADILDQGGSILGSSRGEQDKEVMVDTLERLGIDLFFMIGGDGTFRGALQLAEVITRRGLPISVVGVPKTIDNDIRLTSRTFGFETAVKVAVDAVKAAHNEAEGYRNGVGLVKLMGRHSGFIAAATALAQQDVNFVLIPELDFDLDGEGGFLAALERRLAARHHAVVVVAEGAGQKFFAGEAGRDASGNLRLHDVGHFLKEKIATHFAARSIPTTVKYIDPSYMVRSLPANPNDSVFCSLFGRDAVHAAMAGKTKLFVGYWHDCFVHVPLAASVGRRKQVDLEGRLWLNVLAATGQGGLKNEA